ncbi:class I SAM-dependent methyltransferase [Pedobacter frigiditerrae]|uniref:class I SAM-dependent methyltransferase n=1 Tax=Pedobacter frigiditerrae TaxID=2530452 RepID=UPI002930D11B|nr:class I SAM-dependent methyltransferase [Pedobacter frigiditerrae]
MIQSKVEIENWYEKNNDPWAYDTSHDDLRRKEILLREIPKGNYENVLDIGCGNGFITKNLPGKIIIGMDISENVIKAANKLNQNKSIKYLQKNIFDLYNHNEKYDMIIITGVLYPQYIGNSSNLIHLIIDKILQDTGILITVHINEWYQSRFPFNFLKEVIYPYQNYLHKLEVYQK